jgi:predicted enzyme related to lactoylglutathione lyase
MVGGIFDMNAMGLPKEIPEHWLSYLSVDDIDKRVEKAKKAGATIMREPFDVPGVGRIAILKEPGGAVLGWMTPTPM